MYNDDRISKWYKININFIRNTEACRVVNRIINWYKCKELVFIHYECIKRSYNFSVLSIYSPVSNSTRSIFNYFRNKIFLTKELSANLANRKVTANTYMQLVCILSPIYDLFIFSSNCTFAVFTAVEICKHNEYMVFESVE